MFSTMKPSLLCLLLTVAVVTGRIHKLFLTDDDRHYVDLTTFGFFQGGMLDVHMINFMLPTGPVEGEYGFTLDRTVNDAINPYLEAHTDTCFLNETESGFLSPQHPAIVFLKMDFKRLKLNITCKGEVTALHLYHNRSAVQFDQGKRQSQYMFINRRRRDLAAEEKTAREQCSNAVLNITKETRDGYDYYNTSFAMYVASSNEEGLYNLYFHNCPRATGKPAPLINTIIEIYESNDGNFLSAGEMPLPALYSMMSLIFFLSAGFWTFLLRTSRHTVYRIHIIMCVLVYLKALSLAFHAINYHFIQTRGEHVTAWAILYYITHLLKGAVLFVTIVLVGTGWNFIKHILADRDKKIFMIVIPLQVVANVAEIIIAESEEGAAEHNAWRDVFIFVDLLCCVAILFPVVWSIHHLQDASSTDGKAAINLRKLKLFRHFYIMVVCYIYFTRIIVSLLKITVPFQYSWIDEMFREMATFVFFVMTGYKFRPAAANPYFTPSNMDDVEPQVLSEIGVLEGVTKISRGGKREDQQPLMENYDSN
ncbi:protein GPR107 isoform X2 [Hyposmocoma kahamanoa]|uniref:protein GPR107 isoform X1 n=1 Tax=Hyposmocoma kahamanoa TaxID=1477025 RepID=UPI000E6D5C45|nr:protein GPR107 isoform X1 [Hyposmocoma kahamanoa]XP_026316361.1 protein GPR107 isoform X2 [Hyposmocoma kahamanoa]